MHKLDFVHLSSTDSDDSPSYKIDSHSIQFMECGLLSALDIAGLRCYVLKLKIFNLQLTISCALFSVDNTNLMRVVTKQHLNKLCNII